MAQYAAEGIVCARYKLGDSDRIVHIYSKTGLIRAVAKGARKPKSKLTGRLEPFCRCHMLISKGKSLDIVSQVELINPFMGLRSDLTGIAIGSAMLHLVERVAEHESNPGELYPTLIQSLTELEASLSRNRGISEAMLILSAFELKTASILGYVPSLDSCVSCGSQLDQKSRKWQFDMANGGFLCAACAASDPARAVREVITLSPVAAGVIRMLSRRSLEWLRRLSVTSPQLAEVRQVLESLLTYHLDLNLKSYKYLRRYLSSRFGAAAEAARVRALK